MNAEHRFEAMLFFSRWLMAPFYVGLLICLAALLVAFGHELIRELPNVTEMEETQVILWALTLIDMSLAANLLLMVVFAGYENFVSKLDIAGHPDRPDWMGKIDFSAMKLKLIASIVAISAIHLLKAFLSVQNYTPETLMWLVLIHMAFVTSGLMLALMDYIIEKANKGASH